MLPSRDELASAIRALDTAAIRAKLASGELTEIALVVATEELNRRGPEDDDGNDVPVDDFHLGYASIDVLREPLGWRWMNWLVLLPICMLIVMSFGVSARNEADQAFLYGVIVVQSIILAVIVRAISSIFTRTYAN